jgi:hypothetical protein
VTPADFIVNFPAFAAETPARIQSFIDRADPFFDVARWGDLYSEGLGNFVAHSLFQANLAASNPGSVGTSGLAIKKKVGDVEVGYSDAIQTKVLSNPYLKTAYGQQYLYLLRTVGIGATAV